MSRRPAVITQADVARAIRAAMQAGAAAVEVRPDGSIMVHLHQAPPTAAVVDAGSPAVDAAREIVL